VRLFERLHKQLILTPAGLMFLPEISEGFRRHRRCDDAIKSRLGTAALLQLGLHAQPSICAAWRLPSSAPRIPKSACGCCSPPGLHETCRGQKSIC